MDKIEGIILKHINYKESSLLLYVYTAEGMRSFILPRALTLKSQFLSSKETMNQVEIICSGKTDLKMIKEMNVVNSFSEIKKDVLKYTYSLHLFELLYALADGHFDHQKAYLFLLKILNKIAIEEDYIPYINMFEAKLLYLLGVNPRFHECVVCGKEDGLVFSVEDGGMVCIDHDRHQLRYSFGVIELFAKLYYYDLSQPVPIESDKETIKELRKLLDHYYMYHLNKQTKSRIVLEGLIGY